MAYKFQFGTTKLSGSTTFEESLIGESTISGSGRLSGKELILDAAGVIGTSADADLMTLTSNKVSVAGDLSASLAVSALDLLLDSSGKIGVEGDVDLIQLAANSFKVNGAVSGSGAASFGGVLKVGDDTTGVIGIGADADLLTLTDQVLTVAGGVKGTTLSGSSTLDVAGVSRFGPENKTTISTAGVISGSGISTLYSVTSDAIIAQTADINGGTVDGTTIGGNTAAAGTFTNISGSGTLQALGVVTLGNGKTSVSVEGVLSSSAISTFDEMTMDRASIGAFLGNLTGSGNLELGGTVTLGNSRLVVSDAQVLMTGPVHVSGAAFSEEAITTANVAANKSRLAFFDIDSGEMKTTDFKVYADVLAGTGITATAGVLSVDTTGGDSMSATHIPVADYGNFTLATGINFMVNAATGSCSFLLPSGSAGDVVIVKTAADVSSTNFVKISSSVATGDQIDGFSEARIESPFGAVSLIYSNSDAKWVIY